MTLPKTWADGEVLYAADLNSVVVYNTGWIKGFFLNLLQADYNGETIIIDNLEYDGFTFQYGTLASAGYDTGASTVQYDTLMGAFVATSYDDFETGSIDATKWTTSVVGAGTVTEAGGFAVINSNSTGTAILRSNGSSGLNLKTADCSILFKYYNDSGGGSPWPTVAFKVYDGASSVNIQTMNFGGDANRWLEVYFDTAGEQAKYRFKGTGAGLSKNATWGAWSSWVDLSSLGANWYAEISNVGAGAGTNITSIYEFFYVQGAVSQTFVTSDKTSLNTINAGIIVPFEELQGGTAVYSASGDGGVGYDAATGRNRMVSLTTPGSTGKAKIEYTTTADKPIYLYEFGVYYET